MRKCSKLLTVLLVLVMLCSLTVILVACNPPQPKDLGAYLLSDKGTYLSFKNSAEGDRIPNLTILYEQDESLKNTYSMIAVDGAKFDGAVKINEKGADAFIKWMLMPQTTAYIKDFGVADYDAALFYILNGAPVYNGTIDSLKCEASDNKVIRISTTTSVNDTGLLAALETQFEQQTGWDMQVASAGTGAAIQAAKDGNADLILVHSASQERAFVVEGYARKVSGISGDSADAEYPERISFMYNYFVLIGPAKDPANVKSCANIVDAFKAIADTKCNFVSRGDASGTHTAEVNLWKKTDLTMVDIEIHYESKGEQKTDASVAPQGDTEGKSAAWYISAGQGMGACLTMASNYATK